MFLTTKDGIMCDLCGAIHKDRFEYYTTETTKIKVINNQKVARADIKFNKDVCPQCYEDILSTVRKHLGPFKAGHIKCDLSSIYKSGTFDYYTMVFGRVIVDKDLDPPALVQERVMDLNLINGFDDLTTKAEVISKRTRDQGVWS